MSNHSAARIKAPKPASITTAVKAENLDESLKVSTSFFIFFPKLPIELRLKIWKLASFETRNTGIWAHEFTTNIDNEQDELFLYKTGCPHPAVLHTNSESRKEGLEHYKLDFGVTYDFGPKFQFSFPPKTYIDWQADRLCVLENSYCGKAETFHEDFIKRCTANKVQFMAVNVEDDDTDDFTCLDALPRSNCLRELVLFSKAIQGLTKKVVRRLTEFQDLGPLTRKESRSHSGESGHKSSGASKLSNAMRTVEEYYGVFPVNNEIKSDERLRRI